MSIWLVHEDEDQQEHHMRWHGIDTIDQARAEFNLIKLGILNNHQTFPNTYFYESDESLYGYPEEEYELGEFKEVFRDLNKIKLEELEEK